MQRGEGLHLANFLAANFQTSLIYDRELLAAYPGTDLPWSDGATVARMGVEYRNDLLGHMHALGPSAPPTRYQTGHVRSDQPQDWPPNLIACQELRSLGATVGYAHPAATALPADGSTSRFFQFPRSVEARELVADAALGMVDSIDLISPFNDEGAVFLYHRLLSCGLRLAATAGWAHDGHQRAVADSHRRGHRRRSDRRGRASIDPRRGSPRGRAHRPGSIVGQRHRAAHGSARKLRRRRGCLAPAELDRVGAAIRLYLDVEPD